MLGLDRVLLNPGPCGLSGPVSAESFECVQEYGVIGSPPTTYFILPESGIRNKKIRSEFFNLRCSKSYS